MVCLFFPVWISVLTGCVVATAVEAAGLDVGMAWAALAEIHEERLRQEQQAGQPNTPADQERRLREAAAEHAATVVAVADE